MLSPGGGNKIRGYIVRIVAAVASICCCVYLGNMFYHEHIERQENAAKVKADYEQRMEEKAAFAEQMQNKSFYQKLAQGADVNILVIGDSIGAGAGAANSQNAWFNLLKNSLYETYGSRITFTNVSMMDNTAYAGYVRMMELNDKINYDLAIICFGQDDDESDQLPLYYESILRELRFKYSKCSVISILGSSQREYTEQMQVIQSLCEHYDADVADIIQAFLKNEAPYDDLMYGGNPNTAGHKIYFETVKNIIDTNVANDTSYHMEEITPVNADVTDFDTFLYYEATQFKRVDDVTYQINVNNISGMLGIDYTYLTGRNTAQIYIDGTLVASPTVVSEEDYDRRHILLLHDGCTVEDEIRVVFGDVNQAIGFEGLVFSNVSE